MFMDLVSSGGIFARHARDGKWFHYESLTETVAIHIQTVTDTALEIFRSNTLPWNCRRDVWLYVCIFDEAAAERSGWLPKASIERNIWICAWIYVGRMSAKLSRKLMILWWIVARWTRQLYPSRYVDIALFYAHHSERISSAIAFNFLPIDDGVNWSLIASNKKR